MAVAPGIVQEEVADRTRSEWPQLAADILFLAPVAAPSRAALRRRRRLLQESSCSMGVACFVGAPARGTTQVVIQWPGVDQRFVDLVAAVDRQWDLQTVVVGTAGMTKPHLLPADVVASAGPASLSRSLSNALGRRPEWEVQHGKTAITAATSFLDRSTPGIVAIPHTPHRPGECCAPLELALRAKVPVLLA